MPATELNVQIQEKSAQHLNWLTEKALPIWASVGRFEQTGGFAEAIALDTQKATNADCRARVQPRQIYSFLEGGKLGWSGDWQTISRAGYEWYLKTYFKPDGTVISAATQAGASADEGFDLYNQAFALFAFAHIAKTLDDLKDDALARAHSLMDHLQETLAHSEIGFREDNPDRLPLRSNPQMHLFEAMLALENVEPDARWTDLADMIAELALTRFIDPVSGGLREFFDHDWSPMPGDQGRIMEPGHQFEWAWLLTLWGTSRKEPIALHAARRVYQIGRTHGIDRERQVAIMSLHDDFSVHDPMARLWGQTEWIKAACVLACLSFGVEQTGYQEDIISACDALEEYYADVPAGLWRDKIEEDGTFKDEPAPASSFYHIVCAISQLKDYADTL
ncbi:mannose-6-phosphate isomerase [Roseibium sp. TrichSKD4]|uniref:AGE family epimerase/isomerase n=1 Tax=Roseibium sp. TrichSKD4 TaxID=744980 RepID=UPI0001E57711|nr:AGE family epimerase/isomerase [Roseibium sp. TrichSKD4]EFO29508.1 mannose-6-phosphate isomerase [Roseibium sp. TrichSKD4]